MQTNLMISADFENLRIPAKALQQTLSGADISADIIGQCELALQELLTNLVKHAYSGAPDGKITIQIQVNVDRITIKTEDSGLATQIDLESITMPDPGELQESGYGMAIIKGLMDEVSYRREDEKNYWILVKQLKQE